MTQDAPQLDFGCPATPNTSKDCENVKIAGREVTVTPVFYAYWRFAAERQKIFFKRLARANVLSTTWRCEVMTFGRLKLITLPKMHSFRSSF
ncbi:hypothetical protein ABIF33_002849 [Bradyrhizobium elkanii]